MGVLRVATPRSFSEVLLPVCKSLYVFYLLKITSLCLRILVENYILVPKDLAVFGIPESIVSYSPVLYPMKIHLLDFGSNLLL